MNYVESLDVFIFYLYILDCKILIDLRWISTVTKQCIFCRLRERMQRNIWAITKNDSTDCQLELYFLFVDQTQAAQKRVELKEKYLNRSTIVLV